MAQWSMWLQQQQQQQHRAKNIYNRSAIRPRDNKTMSGGGGLPAVLAIIPGISHNPSH